MIERNPMYTMTKRKLGGSTADPTLPKTPVTLDGIEYTLCLDLNALAQAESELTAAGHKVNILYALPELVLSSVRVLFLAGLRRFHPELASGFSRGRRTKPDIPSV